MSLPKILLDIPKKVIKNISRERAYLFRVIPIKDEGGFVEVCIEDNLSFKQQGLFRARLDSVSGKKIRINSFYLTSEEMDEALERYYP
jgi:hypothetical protein